MRYAAAGTVRRPRVIATRVSAKCRLSVSTPKENGGHASDSQSKPASSSKTERARQADRELLLDVLSSSATKRDAKSYISRFNPGRLARGVQSPLAASASGQFAPDFSGYGSKFNGGTVDPGAQTAESTSDTSHAAVILIRNTSSIDDKNLAGIGNTVTQLSRLGLACLLVVDSGAFPSHKVTPEVARQIQRVITEIESSGTVRARRIDRAFRREDTEGANSVSVKENKFKKIYESFCQNAVVVVDTNVSDSSERLTGQDANAVVLSLARRFAEEASKGHKLSSVTSNGFGLESPRISLDRIFVIDSHGGIANISWGGTHVFINLEQEFTDIRHSLGKPAVDTAYRENKFKPAETDSKSFLHASGSSPLTVAGASMPRDDLKAHLGNLELARNALAILPSTSSALIVTPFAAAVSASSPVKGVGTRSQRNPLIHNLLTDKPLFSSSLPRGRLFGLDSTNNGERNSQISPPLPTFLRHGMPVTIIPDANTQPWQIPQNLHHIFSLDDPRINKQQLVELIEDSFSRQLDAEDYFSRLRQCLAGIIIAGDYEGAAILTWERPRIDDDGGSGHVAQNPHCLVPYLDKFAVRRKSQGGGVADVVFSAIVRRCFPDGVCWRSRNGNPVNKWYFERARGGLKLAPAKPGAQAWTMFWTTPDLEPSRFAEYADVCLAVQSSWAD